MINKLSILIVLTISLNSFSQKPLFEINNSRQVFAIIPCEIEIKGLKNNDLSRLYFKTPTSSIKFIKNQDYLSYFNNQCSVIKDTLYIGTKNKTKILWTDTLVFNIKQIDSSMISWGINSGKINIYTIFLYELKQSAINDSSFFNAQRLIFAELLNFDYNLSLEVIQYKLEINGIENEKLIYHKEKNKTFDCSFLLNHIHPNDILRISNLQVKLNKCIYKLPSKTWVIK